MKPFYDAISAVIYREETDARKIRAVRDRRFGNKNSQKLFTDPVWVTVTGIFKKNMPTQTDSDYERNAAFRFVITWIDSISDDP